MGKLFIASSERNHPFAAKIRDELFNNHNCSADTWKDALEDFGARSKIEALDEWTKNYEFAVIIFSQGDLETRADMKTQADCVFEAGLFMAAIGRQRCLLLSSVETRDLPSDLGGINLYKFQEPQDVKKTDDHAARYAAGAIADWLQKDPPRLPCKALSRENLMKREKTERSGGELKEDQVVVASVQPLELGYEAARQVRENLDNNISYVYFFEGNEDAADKIPQLLQLVLVAGLTNADDAPPFKTRAQLMSERRPEILEALTDMCWNDKLNIFFLREWVDIEYCMHNAASDKLARLYLKHDNDFFEWMCGPQAYRFWCAKRKYRAGDPECPDAIFHAGRDFELNDGPFLRNLKMGMRKYFRDSANEIMDLCLKGPV